MNFEGRNAPTFNEKYSNKKRKEGMHQIEEGCLIHEEAGSMSEKK